MGSQSNLMRFCDITNLKEDTIIDYTTCTGKRDKMSIKDANDIPPSSLVMWTQYPHANSGLSMSRWFQFMATSMVVELDSEALHQYHRKSNKSHHCELRTVCSTSIFVVVAVNLKYLSQKSDSDSAMLFV